MAGRKHGARLAVPRSKDPHSHSSRSTGAATTPESQGSAPLSEPYVAVPVPGTGVVHEPRVHPICHSNVVPPDSPPLTIHQNFYPPTRYSQRPRLTGSENQVGNTKLMVSPRMFLLRLQVFRTVSLMDLMTLTFTKLARRFAWLSPLQAISVLRLAMLLVTRFGASPSVASHQLPTSPPIIGRNS
jgi:hypothetical protein